MQKRVVEKPHLLTPSEGHDERRVWECDELPPEMTGDQQKLQDVRAEGAISLTRHGQRLTIVLSQNQNEVRP